MSMVSKRAAALMAFSVLLFCCYGVPQAGAQEVALTITIKNHRFQPAEIKAPAGKPIKLTVKNEDPTPEEFESKALRVEKVIAGNSEGVFNLRPLQPGRYRFVGEYNEATAQGHLVVE
ncbi:MAG: cupredoxin domain-containing protein [Xanthobacteraceae bacterium]|nr:cupredoxin domain-containing protein [Xanthobacteraceae bacterium]